LATIGQIIGSEKIYGHDIVIIDLHEPEGIFLVLYKFLRDKKRCSKQGYYSGF
jgi:hypothetical protein